MTTIGTNPLKEHYMRLITFGAFSIKATQTANDPEVYMIDIGASTRHEVVSMETRKDETIDQFCDRMRSMLRALANAEPKDVVVSSEKGKK